MAASMTDLIERDAASRVIARPRTHSRVRRYAAGVARHLGLSEAEAERIGYAAIFHDAAMTFGASGRRHPGLVAAGGAVIRHLCDLGSRLVVPREEFAWASPILGAHHAHWDGSGHPAGLAGEAIPIGSRIMAALETFDGLVSDAPFGEGIRFEAALLRIRRESGTRLDPEVVDALHAVIRNEAIGLGARPVRLR